jgi:2-polyprenyl-3-methyl-5-hydroxy-6-metoxy-1,4-benzoquinol methylase
MTLSTVQAGWDQAAREDAMFNILTDPGKANRGWEPAEFFQHGQVEIDRALGRLQLSGGARALDFGCGVGRLTQALAGHYKGVDGVDISEEMIVQARALNSCRRVRYHHNTAPNLKLFKARTFDLVYSMLVLQHMPQELQHGYVREFFRVLKPGGAAMFEMPDGPDYRHPNAWLSMYGVPRGTVEEWVAAASGTLVDVELIDEPSQWQCYRYTATR